MQWAIRFLKLPEKEFLFKKRKYTKNEIAHLIGIKKTENTYGPSCFMSFLVQCGALKPDGFLRSSVPYYTIDREAAYEAFSRDPLFNQLEELFKDRFYDGKF